jgi:hypothetical protein
MAKDRISQLYERHKEHPRGRNSENHPAPYHPRSYDASPRDGALRNNHVQDIENAHDNAGGKYDNDVSIKSWLRNGDATSKPSFDFGGAYRKDMRSQIKDRPVDHNRHHSEFERHNSNDSMTHDQMAHDYSKRHVPTYEKRGELGGDNSQPKRVNPKKWG